MRFISNRSTGVMGYKIAEEASRRGHKVTLVSGPVKISPPKVHKFISIETAEELSSVLKKETKKTDCLVMCAAVADFRMQAFSRKKIKRCKGLTIKLVPNKDILAGLAKHKKHNLFVGFNLETSDPVRNAGLKLKNKNLDFIVANRLTKNHNPFGEKKLDVSILDRFGRVTNIKAKNKGFIANVLLDKIEELWYLRRKGKL